LTTVVTDIVAIAATGNAVALVRQKAAAPTTAASTRIVSDAPIRFA